MNIISTLLALCLFVYSSAALSQIKYHVPKSRGYSIEQGLSQPTVYRITEDLDGFIWIGTQRGIERFDGNNFISFEQNDDHTKGLQGSSINDLHVDYVTGHLWIATINGLSSLDTKSFKFTPHDIGDSERKTDNIITAIFQDRNGVLWVGTRSGIYKRGANDKFVAQSNDSRNDEPISVTDIDSLADGRLVIATGNGIRLYDPEKNKWTLTYLQNEKISTVTSVDQNQIWAGTSGNGLYRISGLDDQENPSIKNFNSENGLVDNIINDVLQLSDGSIWVATTGGISIFPNSRHDTIINHVNVHNSLPASQQLSHNVLSLFVSSTNNVFFGTLSNGFNIVDPKSILFETILFDNKLLTYSVAVEDGDVLWVVNELGLYRQDTQSNQAGPFPRTLNNQNSANKITSLLFDNNRGTLWAASRDGLSRLNTERTAIEMVDFEGQHVYSISLGPDGCLWLGMAADGLFKYDYINKKVVKHWQMPLVLRTLITNDGRIWVATIGGLYLIDALTYEITLFKSDPQNPNSLPYDVVTWISQISPSEFLVGTQSKGLVQMHHKNFGDKPYFKQLFGQTRLAKLAIGAVVKDANDDFWITTTEGLARSNSSLTELQFFDGNDGASASGYFIGAHATDRQQKIYFAGAEGLTVFHPDDINNSAIAPKLIFTQVRTLSTSEQTMSLVTTDKLLANNKKEPLLRLTPNNLAIDIEFSAFEFGSPKNIKYAYMLEGFHSAWQNTDNNKRSISFTNLRPGEYRFVVKSTNRYGKWANNDISLTVIVESPWWQTRLAIVSFVLLTSLAFYLLYQWRTYNLKRTSLRLSAMVEEKTKDLESANKKLKTLINLDPLTNAFNRRGFKEFAKREFSSFQRNNKVFTIILLDVDNFKHINDKYGHDVGDETIVFMVKQLKAILRAHDILARWGGEEFIVLLPGATKYDGLVTAEKLRQSVEGATLNLREHQVNATVSGGVAQVSECDSLEACIKKADILLFEAKREGRNRIKG